MQWSTSDSWINSRLGAWISSSLGETATSLQDISVTFGPPGADGGPANRTGHTKQGINLHLLTLAPHEQATVRVERTTGLQLVLRYLATSWAEQSDAVDSLLCTLAFYLLGRGAGGPDGQSEIVVEPARLRSASSASLCPARS